MWSNGTMSRPRRKGYQLLLLPYLGFLFVSAAWQLTGNAEE